MRKAAMPVLAILGLLFLWAPSALSPDTYLSHRDIFRLHLPLRHFLQTEWWAGRWPTWLPNETLGLSFTGSPIAASFHPLQVLLLFLPADVALKWQVLILWVLAGVGVSRLSRLLGADTHGQWLSALAYAGSGYLTSLTDNFTYLHGAALLPWVCSAAERLANERSVRHAAKLTALLSLGILGGDLQALLAQAAFSGVLILRARSLKTLGLYGLSWLWVLAVTAPVWPALLEEALASGRVAGLSLKEAQAWSLHPLRLLELPFGPLFAPDKALLGAPTLAQWLGGFNGALWARSEFLGAVVLLLVPLGLVSAPEDRAPIRYAAMGAFALLLALGPSVGLYGLFHEHLPFFKAFRYPEKWMPWAVLAASVLAARGLKVAWHRPRVLVLPALLLLAFGLLTPLLVTERGLSTHLSLKAASLDESQLSLLSLLHDTLSARASVAAVTAAAVALLAFKFPRFLPLGALCLMVAQGAFSAQGLVATRDRAELKSPPSLLGALNQESDAGFRLASWPRRYGFGRERLLPEEAARRGDWESLAPSLHMMWNQKNLYAYQPTHAGEWLAACGDRPPCASPCARRMGARFCIVSSDEVARLEGLGLSTRAQTQKPKLTLMEDGQARSWASVPGVESLSSFEKWPEAIRRAGVPPGRAFGVGLGKASFPEDGAAVVAVHRPRSELAEIKLSLRDDNWVVVSENCSRGWRAFLDGKEAPLSKMDLVMCGVFVKQGQHTLRLEYHPPGWPWAFFPSVVGLLLLLGSAHRKQGSTGSP